MDNMETIAVRLVEARKNCGMTQGQMAERLFVTTQAISSWERGNAVPETDKIWEIAQILNVTTDWLLSGKSPSEEVLEVTSNLSDRLFDENRMSTYVSAYCNAKHYYQSIKALHYAKSKHDGQYRKVGQSDEHIPYISHPLVLACHALALGLEEDDLLSVCLLHDVCEDCGVEPEDLPVSEEAREAVRLLTKPKGFKKTETEEKAYYDGIAKNRIAIMVKLLDRCQNISSMATCFSDEKMALYIKETQQYIKPLIDLARKEYPEYSNQLFLIRYHMKSVTEAIKHHMRSLF